MLKAFREFNLRLSARIEALLPQCRNSIYDGYDRMAQGLVGISPLRVLDVGGGRESHIAEFCTEGSTVIAFDISAEELSQNQKATQKIVADACREFPLPVGSVDLVTSYCVVEHLPDVSAFCRHAYQVFMLGRIDASRLSLPKPRLFHYQSFDSLQGVTLADLLIFRKAEILWIPRLL